MCQFLFSIVITAHVTCGDGVPCERCQRYTWKGSSPNPLMGVTGTMRGAALRAKETTSVSDWLVVAEQNVTSMFGKEKDRSHTAVLKNPPL